MSQDSTTNGFRAGAGILTKEDESARAGQAGIERLVYGRAAAPPLVSIIIPTLDGTRRGLLESLLQDLHHQSLRDFEVLLIVGDRRQGRAINRGVDEANAPIVVTMDDDTVIGTTKLLENLVLVLEECPQVGMVGASTVNSAGSSWFQRVACRQVPRRFFPIVDEVTDSDMVQHPCLAMRRQLFLNLGGEDEELIRGLDPLLRNKVRQAGYRVVIAPNSYISHPLPDSYLRVLRMYFRNGRGSAYAQLHYPARIYNLSDGFRHNRFRAKVPFLARLARYPLRVLRSLLRGRWILTSVQISYGLGYLCEVLAGRRGASSKAGKSASTPAETSVNATADSRYNGGHVQKHSR